jgi:hypothetical protein
MESIIMNAASSELFTLLESVMTSIQKYFYRLRDLRKVKILVEGVFESWVELEAQQTPFMFKSIESIANSEIVELTEDEAHHLRSQHTMTKEFHEGDLVYVWTFRDQGVFIVQAIENDALWVSLHMDDTLFRVEKGDAILMSRYETEDE